MIVTRITLGFGVLLFGFICWLGLNGVAWAIELVITMLAVGFLIALGSNAFPPLRALPKFRRRDGREDELTETQKQDFET